MPDSTEGASPLQVQRDRDGAAWIKVDSLVEMFDHMASMMQDSPAKTSMMVLADTFRPASMYAELEELASGDNTPMQAHRCSICSGIVITGRNIGGREIIVDAEPVPDGALFPFKIVDGCPVLAPWRPGLDGIDGVRLNEHTCPESTG